jgi:hypothetical protein
MVDVTKPAPMTILQQLIEVCRNTPDRLLSANEIKARVTERFGTNPTSINANTIDRADELMVPQYVGRDFKVLYHGDILAAIKVSRLWQGRYEFDITKARKLASTNQCRA